MAKRKKRAAVAVEMLPLLEKEAAERRNATARLERDQAGKLKPVTQKIEYQGDLKPESKAPVVIRPTKDRNDSMAAAEAAKLTGTNREYVAQAKKLKEQAPQQFERLKSGEATLPEITRKQREERREERRFEEMIFLAPAARRRSSAKLAKDASGLKLAGPLPAARAPSTAMPLVARNHRLDSRAFGWRQ